MNKLFKKSGFILIMAMLLLVSFGCKKKDKEVIQSEPEMEVFSNFGFVDNLVSEDEKDYAEISMDDQDFQLEVEDKDVFDEIEEGEFYKFAYNENNILLSIEKDDFIKDLVNNSMEEEDKSKEDIAEEDKDTEKDSEEDDSEEEFTEKDITVEDLTGAKDKITPEDKVSTENLALLDSYEFDINNNGNDETIAIYIDAEQDSDGEILWDDSQNWLLIVEGQDKDYVLFDNRIQAGNLNYNIYTVGDDFYITTIQTGTANLDIIEYKYDVESDQFISSIKHKAEGNVNMLHYSGGF